MAAELGLEGGRLRTLDTEKVQLLPVPDVEPCCFDVEVAGAWDLLPAEGPGEELPRGEHVPGGQGEVVEAGERQCGQGTVTSTSSRYHPGKFSRSSDVKRNWSLMVLPRAAAGRRLVTSTQSKVAPSTGDSRTASSESSAVSRTETVPRSNPCSISTNWK